jgi:intergrase/recombinase
MRSSAVGRSTSSINEIELNNTSNKHIEVANGGKLHQRYNSYNEGIKFEDIDYEDFELFWTAERKMKTTKERVKRLYNVLRKVLAGKVINEESLREGFHKTTNKKDYVNAVRVLLEYLKVRKLMPREVVQEILEQPFLTPIKSKRRGIYLKDEEIKQAYLWLKEKWKDKDTELLFKLLVFSGIRLDHALDLLYNFDPRKLEFRGRVARYPLTDISNEIKSGEYAFMPAEFARKLKKIKKKLGYQTWENRINVKRWRGDEKYKKSRVDANAIRKWFGNFCLSHDVSESATEYFMGHAIKGMGGKAYFDLRDKLSWREYEKVVDKFPIPP